MTTAPMIAPAVADCCAELDAKAAAWETQVAGMRAWSTVNPSADAVAECARQLRELAHRLRTRQKEVGPEAYARGAGVTPQTVRAWCDRGELPGARRDSAGRWRIPVGAVRAPATTRSTERKRA